MFPHGLERKRWLLSSLNLSARGPVMCPALLERTAAGPVLHSRGPGQPRAAVGRRREAADGGGAGCQQRRVPQVLGAAIRKHGRHRILLRSGMVLTQIQCAASWPNE